MENICRYLSWSITNGASLSIYERKMGICNGEHKLTQYWAWIPDVILFESKTIVLLLSYGVYWESPRPVPSGKIFSALGAGLRIPSEPCSSKIRLIVLLSNRMTSGIHAQYRYTPTYLFFWLWVIILGSDQGRASISLIGGVQSLLKYLKRELLGLWSQYSKIFL